MIFAVEVISLPISTRFLERLSAVDVVDWTTSTALTFVSAATSYSLTSASATSSVPLTSASAMTSWPALATTSAALTCGVRRHRGKHPPF